MGFNGSDLPWSQLEAALSGRTAPDSQRADAPISRKRPAYQARVVVRARPAIRYSELHAHSCHSHLDGASTPEEMAEEAARLGLGAIAITDHDGMYGVPRLAEAAAALGVSTVFGAELSLDLTSPRTASAKAVSARSATPDPPGRHLLVLARDPAGYASLCRAISLAQLRGGVKGHPVYRPDELAELAAGHWLILTGCRKGPVRAALESGPLGTFALDPARAALRQLVARFGHDNVAVELTYGSEPLDDERYDALATLADEADLPVVATTGAHCHSPAKGRLAMTLAAIRARRTLDEMDGWLPAWGGQMLRSPQEMADRFSRYPHAVAAATDLADECAFSLRLVAPDLPPFPVPAGYSTEMDYLRALTADGMHRRYGPRCTDTEAAYRQVDHELALVEKLRFPGYFLIVWELVRFCAEHRILCQGRGSAANSVVCYAIGITAADPIRYRLLFERFLSEERGEPPDIDVDIESDRREEVIQHVYQLHGRHYAAQVANVITYRPRSAVRDVARALGYSTGQQDAWSKTIDLNHWSSPAQSSDSDAGTPEASGSEGIPPLVRDLAAQIADLPRHLGIHSGGMVLCDRPVIEVCPVEHARMENRTVLQWDKDDCAYAGLTKFDLLGLGMLSALRYTFDLIESWHGRTVSLYDIPADDPLVYDMICQADTIGVFQIESRAQMSTLPRLRPRNFYDLVVEIALIRPGPIQGGAVHPYLRRRDGLEPVTYPHPSLEPVLERTLGIPLFQEQLMSVAIHAAGFSPGEADQLRRAMGNKRSHARMAAMRQRLYEGMAANGITGDPADKIYTQIEAFASYGFPESHSISFAYLANASSWLKLYYPAAFLAGLLNAQPMGFYSPQSLVHDARRHGVAVHSVDINRSAAQASVETPEPGSSSYTGPGPAQPAVRLGLASVRGVGDDLADQILAARDQHGPFTSLTDLTGRLRLRTEVVEALATAGAFTILGLSRREALWGAGTTVQRRPDQLDVIPEPSAPTLPGMTAQELIAADLWATGVSGDYPTALARGRLDQIGVLTASALREIPDRTRVTIAGVVTHRQRPPTAGGITFLSLEDETGLLNVVIPAAVFHRTRRVALDSAALLIRGMLERSGGSPDGRGGAINVVAEHIEKLHLGVRKSSRDFR